MALFLSTYINKIDKKGRVSVPSQFRSSLISDGSNSVIIYKSVTNKCIEACSMKRMEKIVDSISQLDPLSEEYDAFATTILAASIQLTFDTEGRVIMPKNLLTESEIDENVAFVGKGQVFEIWNPDKFNEHLKKSQEIAMTKRNMLKLSSNS